MDLSIIVPTYNCREYLDEGLDSIISQLRKDCELIVVDDGSDDGTADMVRSYEGRHENVRIRTAIHQGASGARNIGIDMACGRYISFMDCDDCMVPKHFEQCLEDIKSDADLYIYGIVREYLSGEQESWIPEGRFHKTVSDFADSIIQGKKNLMYSNCNKLYKKSIIDKLSLRFEQKTSFGEDRLFNFSYLPACETISLQARPSLRYIERRKDSMSTKPVPGYMELIRRLHEEKMNCYFSLSKGTTPEQKERYKAADWENEMNKAADMVL